jgi:PGF-pre-PGF domain-containing protein
VGSYTYYVNCSDIAQNSVTEAYGFTILRRTGGGGGGGGSISSGFVVFPPVVVKQDVFDKTWIEIPAGTPIVFVIAKEDLRVTSIKFTSPELANDVSLAVVPVVLPMHMKTLKGAFQYFRIDHENIPDGTEALIRFTVPRWWLIENSYQPEEIVLLKYSDDWTVLPTKYTSRDKVSAYYEAESEGFSYFAIARYAEEVEEEPVVAPPTGGTVVESEPLPEVEPDEGMALWPIALIIAAVLVGISVVAYHLHGKVEPVAEAVVKTLDPMQRAVGAAKQWILVAHMKGKPNLLLHQRLVARGWPPDLAKRLILEVAGADRVEDPLDRIKEMIAEAYAHGRTKEDVRHALEHAGWPAWKIDELLS